MSERNAASFGTGRRHLKEGSFIGIASINPATGETLRTFAPLDDSQIEAKLARAAATFPIYRRTTFADRARMMLAAADILEKEKTTFGHIMTSEMGKLLKAAVDEAVKSAWGCRYYAQNPEAFLRDEPVHTEGGTNYVRYQPIGAILAVMPWNFPFWQVVRFGAAALMAGN